MKTKKDLFLYFDQLNIARTTQEHEPLYTVEQADRIAHQFPGAHIKNLFLKDDDKQLWLLVVESHAKVELKKVAQLLAARKLRFADADLLKYYLGVLPGSVTPFGLINDTEHKVRLVIDHTIFEHSCIHAHPLENSATTSISLQDFKKFITATGHSPHMIDLTTYKIL